MTIKELTIKDREIFNNFVSHPLQSYEWGEFRERLGQKVVRIGLFQKNKLSDAFQVFFYQLPYLPFTIGYFPKGRLPNLSTVKILKELGEKNRAIFIKLEPNIEEQRGKEQDLLKLGLVKGKPIFAKYTSFIDLNNSEEELLEKMHPKTRYNIRLAQKHGVIVEEDNSPKAFETYLKLTFETTKRQGFYAHDEKFHRIQWEILQSAGISHLLVAKYQEKILAVYLFFLFKNVLYYPYGASSRDHKEVMAPNLLLWEAIRFGQKNGAKTLDLWGDNPNPKKTDPWYGFHRFKSGYSPKMVELIGAYDLIINPTLYKTCCLVDSLRWKILKLKTKFKFW